MKRKTLTIDERIYAAARRRDKYEAIAENIERLGKRVPDSLSTKLLFAQVDLAVARDDRHDRCVND
jgi:hypothetical protein